MKMFHQIEGGLAITRRKGFLYKQTSVYARGGQVFVPHAGGYVRVGALFGDAFGTNCPDLKVLELEGAGICLPDSALAAPTYTGTGA